MYGIAWHEKTLGQLFCDGSARQIVDMLLAECGKGAVELRCDVLVDAVRHADGQYHVTAGRVQYSAPALVIATGGPSIPKMGATGFAYDLARQFGLKVVEPRPALVPLTLHGEDAFFRELSGVSAEVVARCGKAQFPRSGLVHPSRAVWPGDFANFVILAEMARRSASISCPMPKRAGWWRQSARGLERRLRGVLGEALPDRLAAILVAQIGPGA